jgi:antitoxin component YwqK of YwqJK toxin-antitoxin module
LKDGISKYYFPNGNISDFFIYKNNLLDGKCYSYDVSGKVIREVEYKDGELIK